MTGSELLARWLAQNEVSLRTFAEKVGTTASNVKEWRGKRKPGVTFALAIEKATKGAVPVKSWREER